MTELLTEVIAHQYVLFNFNILQYLCHVLSKILTYTASLISTRVRGPEWPGPKPREDKEQKPIGTQQETFFILLIADDAFDTMLLEIHQM